MDHYLKVWVTFLTSVSIITVQWSSVIALLGGGDSSTGGGGLGHHAHERMEVEDISERAFSGDVGDSLYVDISNNMAGSTSFDLDCNAYSSSRQLLEALGPGPVKPKHAVIYYVNLLVFTPDIIDCTVTWFGKSKTVTMYDDHNLKLGYLYIQWSVDERGFSLYNTVSDIYDLYKTW